MAPRKADLFQGCLLTCTPMKKLLAEFFGTFCLVIALEAMFAGPICGASMNPARSIAPAVVGLHLSSLWVYVIAPISGALVAVAGCRCMREEGCCGAIPRDLTTTAP